MAWYRKYRPQRIADLHIEPVRQQLQAVLDSGKIAHAYLFTGSKGTGKTSTARILARVLNDPANESVLKKQSGKLQEPDLENRLLQQIAQGSSTVVIEQDAASHRGIDDIRQLQEYVSLTPSEGLTRVVILDEVHMLTTEAFNALLKMLEEPPANVVFILATTELHKVPATVQSRCQLITFRRASKEEIAAALTVVATGEELNLSTEAAHRIAQIAQGSFRDAVKYLEQISSSGSINEAALDALIGGEQETESLLRALAQKDLKTVSELFQKMRGQGSNLSACEQAILAALQERLHRAIAREEKPKTIRTIIELLQHLTNQTPASEPIDGIAFELACLSWCLGESAPAEEVVTPPPVKRAAPLVRDIPTTQTSLDAAKALAKKSADVKKGWESFLLSIRTKSQAVESLLRQARLEIDPAKNVVQLHLKLSFHKEQLETAKYRALFSSTWEEKFPGVEPVFVLDEPEVTVAAQSTESSEDQLLKAVEAAVLSLG